ncbi:hypothetical protein ES705_16636 [subsurface metagenome]
MYCITPKPEELISNINSIVSGSVSDLERVKHDLNNTVDKIYGVTGTIASSDLNMAMGIDEMRLFFEDHQQIPQISRVYKVHKDQLSSDNKIQKLIRALEPFNSELTYKLNNILHRLKNLNNKADLTSLGHLLSQFIDTFLKTLAPDDLIRNISWLKRETHYNRCIFVIIGHDFAYGRNNPKYSEIDKIAQNYTNILQRCDIIKHNPHNWDLTKLRQKLRKSFHDTINYALIILNLRSLHFVKSEKGNKFNNKR